MLELHSLETLHKADFIKQGNEPEGEKKIVGYAL